MTYIGRLAPSPTGYLHLGHAATFLAAFDRARAENGRLYLRIDDLDTQRSKEEYVIAGKEDLRWLGITWDAEFRESERLERYRSAMLFLLEHGFVYPCSCSRKDLAQAVGAPHEETDDEPVYGGRCRPDAATPAKVGALLTRFRGPEPHFWHADFRASAEQPVSPGLTGVSRGFAATNYRFRVPDGESIEFTDRNAGPQRFQAGVDFGDFLVWRKDGLPSYQLASVVDDADMGITEVVRGQDLLKSTARQILLQRALGLPLPAYFHTGLVRDAHGERLAKRHDALSLRTLRDHGVTPAEIRARVAGFLHHSAL